MKRKKLTLEKLQIGSLSSAEQAQVLGGEAAPASQLVIGSACIGNTQGPQTIMTGGCTYTPTPTQGSVMTCPAKS